MVPLSSSVDLHVFPLVPQQSPLPTRQQLQCGGWEQVRAGGDVQSCVVVGRDCAFLQMHALLIILGEQADAHTGLEERLGKEPGKQPGAVRWSWPCMSGLPLGRSSSIS